MVAREVRILMKREVEEAVLIARVARQFSVSRQMIYNIVKAKSLSSSGPRDSKLGPLKEYLESRLSRLDLPATMLHREIHELGFRGGLTIVKSWCGRTARSRSGW